MLTPQKLSPRFLHRTARPEHGARAAEANSDSNSALPAGTRSVREIRGRASPVRVAGLNTQGPRAVERTHREREEHLVGLIQGLFFGAALALLALYWVLP